MYKRNLALLLALLLIFGGLLFISVSCGSTQTENPNVGIKETEMAISSAQLELEQTREAIKVAELELEQTKEANRSSGNSSISDSQVDTQATIDAAVKATEIAKEQEEIVSNPTGAGRYRAGKAIRAGDFSLIVEDNIRTRSDRMGIRLFLENLGSRAHIFRYSISSISVTDDVGTEYPPNISGEDLYNTKQENIEPGKIQKISSNTQTTSFMYQFSTIPSYVGPLPPNATKLIIKFEGFGPYSGTEVEIKL